jgi:Branched-chain amino acid transport protein (AzlD)
MTVWLAIAVVAVVTIALKAAGPAVLGERRLPARAVRVVDALAAALLTGLPPGSCRGWTMAMVSGGRTGTSVDRPDLPATIREAVLGQPPHVTARRPVRRAGSA